MNIVDKYLTEVRDRDAIIAYVTHDIEQETLASHEPRILEGLEKIIINGVTRKVHHTLAQTTEGILPVYFTQEFDPSTDSPFDDTHYDISQDLTKLASGIEHDRYFVDSNLAWHLNRYNLKIEHITKNYFFIGKEITPEIDFRKVKILHEDNENDGTDHKYISCPAKKKLSCIESVELIELKQPEMIFFSELPDRQLNNALGINDTSFANYDDDHHKLHEGNEFPRPLEIAEEEQFD